MHLEEVVTDGTSTKAVKKMVQLTHRGGMGG